MPCLEGNSKHNDVALQILGAETPHINVNGEADSIVTREITQTDHLNNRLLKSLLARLNVMADTPAKSNIEEDDHFQEFDD